MPESGRVMRCPSVKKWIELTAKAELVIANFTAPWCGPSRKMESMIEELANEFCNVTFVEVDIDELEPVATVYDVTTVPHIILLKDGKEHDRLVGIKEKKHLMNVLQKYANDEALAA